MATRNNAVKKFYIVADRPVAEIFSSKEVALAYLKDDDNYCDGLAIYEVTAVYEVFRSTESKPMKLEATE